MAFVKGSRRGTMIGNTTEYTAISSVVRSPDLQADILYIVYFLVGTAFVLPWNAFVTGVDYFDYLYPNTHIDRVFTVVYLVPCLIVLGFLVSFGSNFGTRTRITAGLSVFIVSIVIVPIMEVFFIRGKQGTNWTHAATVFAVGLAGVGDACVQGTIIGSANQLPGRFMQALVSGTGFSGVLISFLRIITKFSFSQTPDGLRNSANVYFTVSALFLGMCIVSYNLAYERTVAMTNIESRILMTDEFTTSEVSNSDAETGTPGIKDACEAETSELPESSSALAASCAGETLYKSRDPTHSRSNFWQVCHQLRWLAGAMILTYVITLAIFPGFLTEDVKSPFLGDWYPVLLIALFNVFDLVGKSLMVVGLPEQVSSIIILSLARLLFFPLYSACVHGPHLFRTEAPVFLLTALLGATNGYLTTCLFLSAPQRLGKGSSPETVGLVMVMGLEVGLTLGSFLSWVWVV